MSIDGATRANSLIARTAGCGAFRIWVLIRSTAVSSPSAGAPSAWPVAPHEKIIPRRFQHHHTRPCRGALQQPRQFRDRGIVQSVSLIRPVERDGEKAAVGMVEYVFAQVEGPCVEIAVSSVVVDRLWWKSSTASTIRSRAVEPRTGAATA